MSIFNINKKKRTVVPYWKPLTYDRRNQELAPVVTHVPDLKLLDNAFNIKHNEWLKNKNDITMLELFSTAVITGNLDKIKENDMRRHFSQIKIDHPLKREQIKYVEREDEISHNLFVVNEEENIDVIKKSLVEFPKNPYHLVELARLYANKGYFQKAKSLIKIAIYLAPQDRYILRSMATLFVTMGEYDEPLYHLHKEKDLVLADSWLLATEIAIHNLSSKKSSIYVKKAKKNLNSPPLYDTSELRSSIATLELGNGKHKQAKKLFNQSMEEANDNSIAQYAWAILEDQEIEEEQSINTLISKLSDHYETASYYYEKIDDWENKFSSLKKYINFQNMAISEKNEAIYIAVSLLDKHSEAAEIGDEIMKHNQYLNYLNQDKFSFINNYAYSLILDNRLDDAEKILDKHKCKDIENKYTVACMKASRGLLLFRKKQTSEGRKLYTDAINGLLKKNMGVEDSEYISIAYINLAREEYLSNLDFSKSLMEAEKHIAQVPDSKKKTHLCYRLVKEKLPF